MASGVLVEPTRRPFPRRGRDARTLCTMTDICLATQAGRRLLAGAKGTGSAALNVTRGDPVRVRRQATLRVEDIV